MAKTNKQLQDELYFYLEKLALVQDRVEDLEGHDVLKGRILSSLQGVQQVLTDAIIVLQ